MSYREIPDDYEPDPIECDGDGWLRCSRRHAFGCGGPDCDDQECEGCDACDPPCWECGCGKSEHVEAGAVCPCGGCDGYELDPDRRATA